MIDSEENFKLLVKSMTPHTRQLLVRYLEAERLSKLDSLELANDLIKIHRNQGGAMVYKDLAKKFAE